MNTIEPPSSHTARGLWAQPGVPHKGWTCLGVEDIGEPTHVCEMCDSQPCRYVHTMWHADYADVLRTGCVCAGHMEGNLQVARRREADCRNESERRKRAEAKRPVMVEFHFRTSPNP